MKKHFDLVKSPSSSEGDADKVRAPMPAQVEKKAAPLVVTPAETKESEKDTDATIPSTPKAEPTIVSDESPAASPAVLGFAILVILIIIGVVVYVTMTV